MAAELFSVLSAPARLKIINYLRDGEQNVSQLIARIGTTQPNMSQHLNTLYKAGILGKRRDGVQIFYRIVDERVKMLVLKIIQSPSCPEVDGGFEMNLRTFLNQLGGRAAFTASRKR
ncbi:MAG: metalloregulator ArsR/SmtB family transcription factor [Rhodoferax sp.]|nr:metalloregulator ArsR/SmtB family transcription factor [Rhodoferax sp.]